MQGRYTQQSSAVSLSWEDRVQNSERPQWKEFAMQGVERATERPLEICKCTLKLQLSSNHHLHLRKILEARRKRSHQQYQAEQSKEVTHGWAYFLFLSARRKQIIIWHIKQSPQKIISSVKGKIAKLREWERKHVSRAVQILWGRENVKCSAMTLLQ